MDVALLANASEFALKFVAGILPLEPNGFTALACTTGAAVFGANCVVALLGADEAPIGGLL
jgi:hypothetical protein